MHQNILPEIGTLISKQLIEHYLKKNSIETVIQWLTFIVGDVEAFGTQSTNWIQDFGRTFLIKHICKSVLQFLRYFGSIGLVHFHSRRVDAFISIEKSNLDKFDYDIDKQCWRDL